jgi:hypothetical protein
METELIFSARYSALAQRSESAATVKALTDDFIIATALRLFTPLLRPIIRDSSVSVAMTL